jgi:hypothetical protein
MIVAIDPRFLSRSLQRFALLLLWRVEMKIRTSVRQLSWPQWARTTLLFATWTLLAEAVVAGLAVYVSAAGCHFAPNALAEIREYCAAADGHGRGQPNFRGVCLAVELESP